jgi:hypothetical protein
MIRRVIGTTLAGLCAVTGPLAGGAFASTTGATLTLSASSARPGEAFTVTPSAGCPSESGLQTVELFFTDQAGTKHSIGSTETDDGGLWAETVAKLPVTGLGSEGEWLEQAVAAGAGQVSAACFTGADPEADDESTDEDADEEGDEDADEGDEGDEDADADEDAEDTDDFSSDSLEEPADDSDVDLEDESGDDESGVATLTYAGTAFTAVGTAAKLSLSATIVKPGASVTVTPSEGCAATGVSEVEVALSADGESGLATASTTTSATGTWSAVTLTIPASTPTGDYAVTASCSSAGTVTSSYSAEPLALGTVRIGAAACGPRSVFTQLTGTYTGDIAGRGDVSLPAKLALTGAGPWTVKVRSASTSELLAVRTLACAKPQYELDVPKTGLSDANKPRARVCNTGRAPVAAILQVQKGKTYLKVDKETLAPGKCVWLEGSKLDKGKHVKAQVRIDAPGKGSDEVTESFTVKRPRR